ncbi:2102_t:CDS:2 [Diversispora eburnea]|uniref:Zinc finger CCCH-type with G patch domain-containing protein n=1 Tax=Diversispora eburnea TaxID=1213867 RepID=A0A9N9AYS0_9GLOM|nr:2102_t:CDS:2 [Diversispora eburnea]
MSSNTNLSMAEVESNTILSTAEIESSLRENETSLAEVNELLVLSPEEPELLNLVEVLQNLIKLQQIQLLESKKNDLLKLLGGPVESSDQIIGERSNSAEESIQSDSLTYDERIPIKPNADADSDLNKLKVGDKCCVPFTHPEYQKVYFLPGLIQNINSETKTFNVLILTPIIPTLRICEAYMSNKCNHQQQQQCKRSHGEEFSSDLVVPYELLFINQTNAYKIGRNFWTKYNDGVWYMAKLIGIEPEGSSFRVIYKGYENQDPHGVVVGPDEIIPVQSLDEEEEIDSEQNNYSDNESDFSDDFLSDDSPPSREDLKLDHVSDDETNNIAEWEKHTTGVASRMMKKMGYKMGEGLGKNNEGIVNPIEVKIFSQGVSLDYINEKDKPKFKKQKPPKSRDNNHKKGKKRLTSQSTRPHKRAKFRPPFSNSVDDIESQSDVFDFLNATLNKGKKSETQNVNNVVKISSTVTTSDDRSKKSNEINAHLTLYQIQNQLNQTQRELKRVNESLKRNEKNPKMAKHFREKVAQIEVTYRELQRKEKGIQSGLDKEKDQKNIYT